jgi:8-oxo-dGTP diphosphatase
MRRFGHPPIRGQRYIHRPGAYAILLRAGEILLTHQAAPDPEFQLPGGGIDRGENAGQALHREIFEETGWAIDTPRRLGAYRRFAYMPEYDVWAEKLCTIWLARPVLRRGPPLEPGHTAVWMTPEAALKSLANAGDKAFLRETLQRGAY